jgi:electron transport complex protein RnfG
MSSHPHPIIRSSLLLGIIALLGTVLLAGVNDLTKDRIAHQDRQRVLQQLNEIIPVGSYNNDLLSDVIEIDEPQVFRSDIPITAYRARMDGKPVAVMLLTTAPDGYNGNIRLLVGIRYNSTVLGVRVVAHKETPGLGDPIEIEKGDWVLGFNQTTLEQPDQQGWAVKRDGGQFDQFTGATISPRAVVKAVHTALLYFDAHKQAIFDQEAMQQDKND